MKIFVKKLLRYLTSLHVHLLQFDQSIASEDVYTMSVVKCRGCAKQKRKLILIKGEKVETQTIL